MSSFILARNTVLELEGGYQSNSNDSGNYNASGDLIGTNYGISAKVLESWLGRSLTVEDMKNLDISTAALIYKKNYWDKYRLGEFLSQKLSEIVFDGIVNHGAGSASRKGGVSLLQTALNELHPNDKIKVDGSLGSQTLAAVNSSSMFLEAKLYNLYRKKRIAYYYEIVDKKPSKQVFLDGWLNRMDTFPIMEEESGQNLSGTENEVLSSIPGYLRTKYTLANLFNLRKSGEARKEWGWIMLVILGFSFLIFFFKTKIATAI